MFYFQSKGGRNRSASSLSIANKQRRTSAPRWRSTPNSRRLKAFKLNGALASITHSRDPLSVVSILFRWTLLRELPRSRFEKALEKEQRRIRKQKVSFTPEQKQKKAVKAAARLAALDPQGYAGLMKAKGKPGHGPSTRYLMIRRRRKRRSERRRTAVRRPMKVTPYPTLPPLPLVLPPDLQEGE